MVLRVHLTAEDLARTRLAHGPGPLVEMYVALRVLQDSTCPVRFNAWKRRAFARLSPQVRMLFDLVPAGGWAVNFLIRAEEGGPEGLFDAVRRTPEAYLRKDLEQWAELEQRIPPWTRRLGREPELFQHVADTLAHAHDQVIAPHWPQIARLAHADRALRIRHLVEEGVEGLLNRLNPRHIRWNPPVLELDMAPGRSSDVHPGGRGLLLIPSLFGSRYPHINPGAEPQPWITFPISHDEHVTIPSAVASAAALTRVPRSLAALLGRTRATTLCAIADHPGSTTTEIANQAGIAPASASEHATILRTAGLTTTSRHRNNVFHTLTSAGIALLNSSTASASAEPDSGDNLPGIQ
ncbi:winged helix-turn-helix domain-containing protein [Streptomyces sp. NPDC006668]|uniref:ArsR/SmtB family transcription factor n=1 Tax=Streptomyces sp. NPDC006668 TaxID=3156903 RepID=UPI0033D7F496